MEVWLKLVFRIHLKHLPTDMSTTFKDVDTIPVTTAVGSGATSTAAEAKNTLHPLDYVIFVVLLMVSAGIGLYFAIVERRKKHPDTEDYLMAGRQMSYGPVTLSLIATFMSSITILGVPAEYYIFGTMFTWYALVYVLVAFISGWVFMPVFYDLRITSTYEYLEMRFNKATRLTILVLYFVQSLMYGGIVIYGPALALSEVSGFSLWSAILSTGLVCIFYTTLGGLKAVIWTDVIQGVIMIVGFLAVIVRGSVMQGGFTNIWDAAVEGGRIDFVHFEADPRIRHTFWSILLGGIVFWLGVNGVNHAQVQRYVCCKSKNDAKKSIVLNAVGLVVILVLAGMTGLTIYATYKSCDPLKSGKIEKPDQLFPYIVMDTLSTFPGVPGLFIAGVYSSSLSTISSLMNALACCALEDFLKPHTRWRPRTYLMTSKFLVVILGCTYILIAYIASLVGGLIRMSYRLSAITSGPIVGVFTAGVVMPFFNSHGATIGVLAGLGSTTWVSIGSVIYPPSREFLRALPLSTDGCPNPIFSEQEILKVATNSSDGVKTQQTNASPSIADFYAISYMHITLLGFLSTIIVGALVSVATGGTKNKPPEKKLLAHPFAKERHDSRDLKKQAKITSAGDLSSHLIQEKSLWPGASKSVQPLVKECQPRQLDVQETDSYI